MKSRAFFATVFLLLSGPAEQTQAQVREQSPAPVMRTATDIRSQEIRSRGDRLLNGPIRSEEFSSSIDLIRVALSINPQEKRVTGRAIIHAHSSLDLARQLHLNVSNLSISSVTSFGDSVAWSLDSGILTISAPALEHEEWPVEISYALQGALHHRNSGSGKGWNLTWSSSSPGATTWMPTPLDALNSFDSGVRISVPAHWGIWLTGEQGSSARSTSYSKSTSTVESFSIQSFSFDSFARANGFIAFDSSSVKLGVRHMDEGRGEIENVGAVRLARTASDSLIAAHLSAESAYLQDRLGLNLPLPLDEMLVSGIAQDEIFDRFALISPSASLQNPSALPVTRTAQLLSEFQAGQTDYSNPWMGDFRQTRANLAILLEPLFSRLLVTDIWIQDGLESWLAVDLMRANGGEAEAGLVLEDLRQSYLAEASEYVRPLVWDRWEHASDMLDEHARAKGAWVFRMLNERLGPQALFEGLRLFLAQEEDLFLDTEILRRSLETVSREDLRRFFDVWVYSAGHPELELSHSFDVDSEIATLTITQHQEGKLVPEAFEFDAAFQYSSLAETNAVTIRVAQRVQTAHIPTLLAPRYIHPDAMASILVDFYVPLDQDDLASQLRNSLDPGSTIRSVSLLTSQDPDPSVLLGLRPVLSGDVSAPLLFRADGLFARMNPSRSALNLLISHASHDNARVRAAALRALSEYTESEEAFSTALAAANSEQASEVLAAAVYALAKLRPQSAWTYFKSALVTDSKEDVVRLTALNLISSKTAAKQDLFETLEPHLMRSYALRSATLQALARVDTHDDLVQDTATSWLESDVYILRATALRVLASGRVEESIVDVLERAAQNEPDWNLKRRLRAFLVALAAEPSEAN